MYSDELKKIAFYKERIIKDFLKKGSFPNRDMINSKLNDIDMAVGIFKHNKIVSGSKFDVKTYNKELEAIYKDLTFLYELLYETTVKEFYTLKAFADSHMLELKNKANMYAVKAEIEANSSSLGKTILFKTNAFDISRSNNLETIDLGTISLSSGSKVACLFDAANISADNAFFEINDGSNTYKSTVYNYNQDFIKVPGSHNKNTYTTSFSDKTLLTGLVQMDIKKNKANSENDYMILAGKNKILIKEFNGGNVVQSVKDRPTSSSYLSLDSKSYIDFYVLNGNSITFYFNKKPVNANFQLNNYKITNLDYIHHFFIEADEGFAFSFTLDQGELYAVKDKGIIKDGNLYFNNYINVNDFYIEEYTAGNKKDYKARIKIMNDSIDAVSIKSIAIKELLKIGG